MKSYTPSSFVELMVLAPSVLVLLLIINQLAPILETLVQDHLVFIKNNIIVGLFFIFIGLLLVLSPIFYLVRGTYLSFPHNYGVNFNGKYFWKTIRSQETRIDFDVITEITYRWSLFGPVVIVYYTKDSKNNTFKMHYLLHYRQISGELEQCLR
ncbi:hypothetical protein COB64_03445 [Candidatus Wolfebacteria bacterium]|nr:MAG: hypothetical protein COB64_03445 [Candidatus Wolfebacteria bacterium]